MASYLRSAWYDYRLIYFFLIVLAFMIPNVPVNNINANIKSPLLYLKCINVSVEYYYSR